jgi:DNA-binding NarL/FixJ family response regulator
VSTRVLLVEDHPLVRQGVRLLLEQVGLEVCGEAETRTQALKMAAATHPDLLLVDLTLTGKDSGLDLIRTLPRGGGAPPVLVYSMHDDWLHVHLAFRAGAKGYVTKRELGDVLLEAVTALTAGGTFTSPRADRALAERPGTLDLDGLRHLSSQEMQIFQLMGQGQGIGDIADAMEVGRKTVEGYCARMLVKIGLKGMKDLRLLALAQVKLG